METPETVEETGAAMPPSVEETPAVEEIPTGEETATDVAADGTPIVSQDELNAVANALAANAQHFAGAEQAERAQDSDIFSGPYDPESAVRAIIESNREVVAARAEYEASKEQTAGFKKTHDEAVLRLSRVIARYDSLRKRSDDPQQFLKVLADDDTVVTLREKLAKELAVHAQLFIDADGLKGLSRPELDTLKLWATQHGPIPPELVVQRAHVAANTEDGASCLRCGKHLGRQADASDYPSEARVGLDCPGEAAPPKKTRKPKKRSDPEAERAQQSAEGQQRAKKRA